MVFILDCYSMLYEEVTRKSTLVVVNSSNSTTSTSVHGGVGCIDCSKNTRVCSCSARAGRSQSRVVKYERYQYPTPSPRHVVESTSLGTERGLGVAQKGR